MPTTTKPDESVQEKNAPPSTTPTTLSPELASNQPSTSSGRGKPAEQHITTPSSRSISRNSSRYPTQRSPGKSHEGDEAAWGSNFWVTLVDPQVGARLPMRMMNAGLKSWHCLLDTNIFLCVPSYRTSELGSSCWTLCVTFLLRGDSLS